MTNATDRNQSLLSAFLSYYRPHLGLFLADTFCALGLSGIDLAFPQILRRLKNRILFFYAIKF